MPSLVPSEDANKPRTAKKRHASKEGGKTEDSPAESGVTAAGTNESLVALPLLAEQNEGDGAVEMKRASDEAYTAAASLDDSAPEEPSQRNDLNTIGKSPGEIAFFKLLHAEFKKATHFFERAQQEYVIREERVRKGMEIMKQPNSIMVGEKWVLLAKSIYRLYKDLLLLETYCIMSYCGFSKILKKHDKVTGYHTRNAFMANIVNKANFTSYPMVLLMISRCEQLYEEVSNRLVQDGKHGLYEDERLFINMIHRLNAQVIEGVDAEGPVPPGRKEARRQSIDLPSVSSTRRESWAISSLRQLVKENDASRFAGQVSESNECNPDVDCDSDGEEDDRKQEAVATSETDFRSNDSGKRIPDADLSQSEKKRKKI